MAAILITMVMMVVISLIVLGFAVVSRHEQSRALNQQLSTQAFYAAESGVNDARQVIERYVQHGETIPERDQCTSNGSSSAPELGNYPTGDKMVLKSNGGQPSVSYTCLLVDPAPGSLKYDGVSGQSIVAPLHINGGNSGGSYHIVISWKQHVAKGGSPSGQWSACPTAGGKFPPASHSADRWRCSNSVLRTDLTSIDHGLSRHSLKTGTLSALMEPVRGHAHAASLSYGSSKGSMQVVPASCNADHCSMSIRDLQGSNFMLRLSSLYLTSDVTINAYKGNGIGVVGKKVDFSGAQALVDVTGDANGVLRRIRVRLPLVNNSNLAPSAAISSNSGVCKRFKVTPGYFEIPNGIKDPDHNNPMCQQTGPYGKPQASHH
jgi:hypothetical protein